MRNQLNQLESEQRFAEEVIRRYETGVGLIQGGYGFTDKVSGRTLRYRGLDDQGNPLRDQAGMPLLTLEGDSPPVVIYTAGTGFLIDSRGTVLTNRHLVRMWEVYSPVQTLTERGVDTNLRFLRIFFAGFSEAYNLQILAVADSQDLAILRTTQPPKGAVPLRLAPAERKVAVGEPIIIMSFPGTFDGILSRLPRSIYEGILHQYGADPVVLAEKLAAQHLIRSLITQGHVSDVATDAITYEARVAGGSSGGPC